MNKVQSMNDLFSDRFLRDTLQSLAGGAEESEKFFSREYYEFKITDCQLYTSLYDGVPEPTVRTCVVLSVSPPHNFPKFQGRVPLARIVGPCTVFSRTKDGKTIVGAVKWSPDYTAVDIGGSKEFLEHAMSALKATPKSECSLRITTESKPDEAAAQGYAYILEAEIRTTIWVTDHSRHVDALEFERVAAVWDRTLQEHGSMINKVDYQVKDALNKTTWVLWVSAGVLVVVLWRSLF